MQPIPHLGLTVIYRTQAGFDIAAIITGHVRDDDDAVYLTQFPPPGVAPDNVNHRWGVPMDVNWGGSEHLPGTWRPILT